MFSLLSSFFYCLVCCFRKQFKIPFLFTITTHLWIDLITKTIFEQIESIIISQVKFHSQNEKSSYRPNMYLIWYISEGFLLKATEIHSRWFAHRRNFLRALRVLAYGAYWILSNTSSDNQKKNNEKYKNFSSFFIDCGITNFHRQYVICNSIL